MRIGDSNDNELNIQFTDLEVKSFTTSYRINSNRKSYNNGSFNDFLVTFIKDKIGFPEKSIVQVFDTDKFYEIINFVISGDIEVIDIEIGNVEYEEKIMLDFFLYNTCIKGEFYG